jgi:hypothetical protein
LKFDDGQKVPAKTVVIATGGRRDFPARNGSEFVMPYETNLAWTHEVPRARKSSGRRISVTLRGFLED